MCFSHIKGVIRIFAVNGRAAILRPESDLREESNWSSDRVTRKMINEEVPRSPILVGEVEEARVAPIRRTRTGRGLGID